MIIKKTTFEYPHFNPQLPKDGFLENYSESKLEQLQVIKNLPIKVWVDAQQNTFEIKMYRTLNAEDIVYLWHKINLQELTIKPGFVDQTLWSVALYLNASELRQVHESDIKDVFSESLISKPNSFNSITPINYVAPYHIFVPDVSDPTGFLSFNYRITMDSSTQYIVEGPSASSFVNETITRFKEFLSPITLTSTQSSLAVDGSITVNVSTDTFIDEVYLEQVYGILNKTRVKLTNGLGSFVLYATGLEAGELVRVKAGHRKFTGISDFSIIVS